MSSVIPRNLQENDDSITNRFPEVHKRGIHTERHIDTHTHTYTHDDSIRRNAMRCNSPKNPIAKAKCNAYKSKFGVSERT